MKAMNSCERSIASSLGLLHAFAYIEPRRTLLDPDCVYYTVERDRGGV